MFLVPISQEVLKKKKSLWYSYIGDQQLWIQTKTVNRIKKTQL